MADGSVRPLWWLFALELAGGLLAIAILKPPIYSDAHAIGMHAVSLLVPYVAAVGFAVVTVLVRRRLDRPSIATAFALFILLTLPFADVLASPIVHLEGDDSYRYSVYAHNILNARTLWGSDGLIHNARYYVDQPGYRYYLAAIVGLLGGEHRGLQLFNMAVLLGVVLWTLRTSAVRVDRIHSAAFAVFVLASAPYAAKNIVYGYTEWFAVGLFMATVSLLLRGRHAPAVVVLALVPFVRQNLLLISMLVAGLALVNTRRWTLVPVYLAVIALPLYHNLYYAEQWRFLVENRGGLMRLTGDFFTDSAVAIGVVGWKLVGYLGYWRDEKLSTIAIGMLFAPLGTAIGAWWLADRSQARRRFLVAAALAAIGPTLFFGSGSPPRFEFVNLTAVLLTCLLASDSAPVEN